MLGKLLKYELRSTARILLPLYPALLVISLLNKILFTVLSNSNFFDIPRGLSMMLYIFMMIAMFVITILIVLQRFYKNLLGEEGYLMFALPVKTEHHILAKLITSFIWFISSALVSVASVFIMLPEYSFLKYVPEEYAEARRMLMELNGLDLNLLVFAAIVAIIVYVIHFILQVYTAMSLGQLISKGRVALSFAAYIGINIVVQTISTTLLLVATTTKDGIVLSDEMFAQRSLIIVFGVIGIGVVLSVAEFFVTRYILTKRLNVE